MQIQNNYNSYSGTEYHKSHTHHITECLYDQEEKPQEKAGTAAGKNSAAAQEAYGKSEAEQMAFYDYNGTVRKQEPEVKKGVGLLRQFWDSMGEEGKEAQGAAGTAGESRPGEDMGRGIYGVSSAIRHLLPAYVTQKWETVRDRVKAKAETAFRNFNKKKDAFLALSDFGGRFRGKKEEKPKQRKSAGRGKPEILTVAADSHLMDSYSKSGEYCRLNDNLSYRRERHEANRRAFSENTEKLSYAASSGREERLDKRL